MSSLRIPGATLQYARKDENGMNGDWTPAIPVDGWVVWTDANDPNNEEHSFDLNFDVGDYDVEILLNRVALQTMLAQIIRTTTAREFREIVQSLGV